MSMETEFWRERALLFLPIIPHGATCPSSSEVTLWCLREREAFFLLRTEVKRLSSLQPTGKKIAFYFVPEMQLRRGTTRGKQKLHTILQWFLTAPCQTL